MIIFFSLLFFSIMSVSSQLSSDIGSGEGSELHRTCIVDSDCNIGEICESGICATVSICSIDSDCDDGNPCTSDVCDEAVGCVYQNLPDNILTGNVCGVGSCQSNAFCVGGGEVCITNPPSEEFCDSLDNDCDGSVDEDFGVGQVCGGIGECGRGRFECGGLTETRCSTLPGGSQDQSSLEMCDGTDNDCNGNLDDVDSDFDRVNDCRNDKCLGTLFDDVLHCPFSLQDTYGCGATQILECKPGKNEGEKKKGLSLGTLHVFINQIGWAKNSVCFDPDSDGDGILDSLDNCPFRSNPEQEDSDGNGVGDVCEETFTCCTLEECFISTIDECRSLGGAVMNCIRFPEGSAVPSPDVNATFNQTNRTSTNPATTQFIANLTRAISTSGVHNNTYNATSYDCDDFAHDLERNLTSLGFNATYTYYWCVTAPPSGYSVGGAAPYGHAVTDIHAPDGTITFIEPQTGQIVDLDFDGDGTVETRSNEHVNNLDAVTDDNCAIQIFEDAAAAAAAGAPQD